MSLIEDILRTLLPVLELLDLKVGLKMSDYVACLRFVTFTALGILHTCHRAVQEAVDISSERQKEQKYKLKRLETLLPKLRDEMVTYFEGESDRLDDRICHFWKRIWVNRVKKELQSLDSDPVFEVIRRRAEEKRCADLEISRDLITIPPIRPDHPHLNKNQFEYWTYQLGKIKGAMMARN